jgi:integrase
MNKKEQNKGPEMEREELDDIVMPGEKSPILDDNLSAIRRSEIISIAPDDIDWNNIYFGKDRGLHSIEPSEEPRRKYSR